MGLDPSAIDPRKIKIYGNEGGMLPQANNVLRPTDLIENAIYVDGEDDAVFNSSDFILFYGQGPDRSLLSEAGIFYYEHNLYSDQNFYFITVSESNGKRIGTSEDVAGSFPLVNTFNDYVYHETELHNELQSGREWFGEEFKGNSALTLQLPMEGVTEISTIHLVSDVMAKSTSGSAFKLAFNAIPVGEQNVLPITGAQYSTKGYHARDTISFEASYVSASGLPIQEITYQYVPITGGTAYLDFLLVSYMRELSLYGNQTIFQSHASTGNIISRFEIANATEGVIWDVTNPAEPKNQSFTFNAGTAVFSTNTSALKKFIIFNNQLPSPEFIGSINNQDLHGLSTPDLIIVTDQSLLSEARRLAAHRQQHSGLQVSVVTTDEIYNEFSSGRQDVTAIRDFAKYLYDKSPGTLKNLLLFGRCSYDYKNRINNNTNIVPTYESYNSLHELETYSSDDYFGFLEVNEGSWPESGSSDEHTLDIGVGRLPIKTIEEAAAITDKIIQYDTDKKSMGRWRKRIVFVADDGSISDGFTSLHQAQANQLASTNEQTKPEFDSRKIFLGTYKKSIGPGGELVPEAKENILESFDRGSLIINYTGHGSEKIWADEAIFSNFDIDVLENKLYPFLVTATCEFGRHDNPENISSAELSLTREKSGSIGLLTSARPVNSGTNYALNSAFYSALFERESDQYLTLGEVFRKTKNSSINAVANRNFSLLADPSMKLALPPLAAEIGDIRTSAGSDTLKALSTVLVKGKIKDFQGNIINDFNGILEATLFDKQTEFITTGKNKPAFTFKEWHNPLFRGKASVTNGEFQFTFIVPKNISYQFGDGKLSLYASDTLTFRDAGGSAGNFKIGGSENNFIPDSTPPEIKLFIGDTTFNNGGLANSNAVLVAFIHDASGVNISNYGIGNTMMAILDDDKTYIVNDYYESETDDFTRGWLNFPLKDLSPGKHSMKLKIWDTHNNPGEATIDFIVTDGETLVIETFGNYPNPFSDLTTLFFTHNRSGDDLAATVSIYDLRGELLKTSEKLIYSSSYRVDLLELSSQNAEGKKLMNGLYLARLVVRSLSNGSKNEGVAKLIVVN